jgi:tetratricopeptide (TPR) repeat protein
VFEPGSIVGHYRILERVGSGGMGVVFAAEDLRLRRRVAIKILPPDADPDAAARFQREARAASALNHPNICTIHDFGEHAGRPYLVMELLAAQTLDQTIAGRPLPTDRLLAMGIQIASALAAAHAAGLVHRDIKPGNIMVLPDDRIKVVDFGLAKHVLSATSDPDAETVAGVTALTGAGLTLGTVAYMSPEQARGDVIDTRSDLFSFGTVLYEMASGRRPFEGKTSIRVLEAVLRDDAPALHTRNPSVPEGLERIVERALQKDPRQRYQHALDIELDLAALRSGTAPVAAVGPTRTAARRGVRRVWMYGAGAGITAALAVAGWLYSARRAPALTDKDALLIADVENTTSDPVFDSALRQALAIDLEQSPFLSLVPDDRLRSTLKQMGRADGRATREIVRDLCERTSAAVAVVPSVASLGSSYVISLEAIAARSGDVVARDQQQAPRDKILDAVSRASAHVRAKLGESAASIQKFDVPLSEATTSSLEALRAYSRGRELLMLSRYPEAVPFFQNAVALDDNFASAYSGLAFAYINGAQVAPERMALGRAAAQRAYDLRNRTTERERYGIENAYNSARGDWVSAKQSLELAVTAYPRYLSFHNNLSVVYGRLGQFEDAIREARAALAINAKAAGSYGNLTWFLRSLGRTAEAKQVIAQARQQGVDSWLLHTNRYYVAILDGDAAARDAEIAWSRGRSEEAAFRELEADRAIAEGRIADAVRAATEVTAPSATASIALYLALAGECERSQPFIVRASEHPSAFSALAPAWCGDTARARAVLPRVEAIEGSDTAVHLFGVPLARAALALHERAWASARQDLAPGLPYALGAQAGYDPTYFLGLSYLGEGNAAAALAAFQQIVDRPGLEPVSVEQPLAWLGLARAAAMANDVPRSRKAYETFFQRWSHADPGLRLLADAHAEYARLK